MSRSPPLKSLLMCCLGHRLTAASITADSKPLITSDRPNPNPYLRIFTEGHANTSPDVERKYVVFLCCLYLYSKNTPGFCLRLRLYDHGARSANSRWLCSMHPGPSDNGDQTARHWLATRGQRKTNCTRNATLRLQILDARQYDSDDLAGPRIPDPQEHAVRS